MSLTYSLKDLKTILSFSDGAGLGVHAFFDGPGQPITYSMEVPGQFVGDFVLATIAAEDEESEINVQSSGVNPNMHANPNLNPNLNSTQSQPLLPTSSAIFAKTHSQTQNSQSYTQSHSLSGLHRLESEIDRAVGSARPTVIRDIKILTPVVAGIPVKVPTIDPALSPVMGVGGDDRSFSSAHVTQRS